MSSGRVAGKLAIITGAARGQGRAHAVRLAEEGARIVAVDIAAPIDTVEYDLSTPDDLDETVRLVKDAGGEARSFVADVRDQAALDGIVSTVLAELGPIDVVVANAGISTYGPSQDLSEQQWQTMLDINLTGVWHTVKAALPAMIEAGRGGSIILTSSINGLKGIANSTHYTAAKHGVVGLMRGLVQEVSGHSIRVNTVHPTCVETGMIINDATYRLFRPDLENPTLEDTLEGFQSLQMLPTPFVQPVDIANAVLWLASDEARYVTGVTLPIDAGCLQK
ncbi:mycofactocin-coupled SDR family oxidoreductase [Pseudonocardia ailaonensis]|uniref:Mycofactocin-coupled SDR family oxidoreductase n=1 Tax=Pseudonocardia ailaonensis TaxID=367279 RepID=A0ABN2NA38_9PSEU